MSFVSAQYAMLFGGCLSLYFWLGRRAQNVLLLVLSYVFYGSWDYRFLSLLWLSTIVDFMVGARIARARRTGDMHRALLWLRVSLVANLGMLGFFKYYGFFAHEAQHLLTALGTHASLPVLQVVLPVGISFYTFQTLSYCIDIYRGELEPSDSLLDFAVFIAFFPQLVAGPIERAKHLLPQCQKARRVRAVDIQEGIWLMLLGYVRKVVIADSAAAFSADYFATPNQYTSVELAAGLGLFAVQIYGDFSGYSDIARGSARLLGFDLMRNFEHPYFAHNVADFWRRWHISLSTWLRDYLYIPLGGNRRGELRTYANLMTTMLLGGLWHGASWNFLIWGGLHGVYLCVHRAFVPLLERLSHGVPWLRVPTRIGGTLLTLILVCFTWLFFRSTSTELTGQYLSGLASLDGDSLAALVPLGFCGAIMLLIDLPQTALRNEHRWAHFPRVVRLPAAALMVVLLLMSHDSGQPFIYFQF